MKMWMLSDSTKGLKFEKGFGGGEIFFHLFDQLLGCVEFNFIPEFFHQLDFLILTIKIFSEINDV